MKLQVDGIKEIVITDPAGLCNPPPAVPLLDPGGMPPRGIPMQPQPSGILPNLLPSIIGGGVGPPLGSPRSKWGVGGEAIQRAGQQVDPEQVNDSIRATLSQLAELNGQGKRILRGEGSDGD